MKIGNALLWVLTLTTINCTLTPQLRAQSIPSAPADIDFAGVTVHLNEQGRVQLQREINQLYVDRPKLRRDIESLRQLTPPLELILEANQLPKDYRYAVLPVTSDGSTGYWGLTMRRALVLKMIVSDAIDERYHPIIATETVAAHLSRLHTASDNHVLTLLRYFQGDTLRDRLANSTTLAYLVLDAQSPALMWKTLARKLAFEREEPVFRPAQSYILYEQYNNVGFSLAMIGRRLKLDDDRFNPFNAWLKTNVIPVGKEYPVLIRVTADEFPVVKSRDDNRLTTAVTGQTDVGFPILSKLPQSSVSGLRSAVFYTINDRLGVQARYCDNVITLAYYGNLSIRRLLHYNELSNQDVVQPGQIYYLERKAKRAKVPFHVVQRNQTLREISNVYGVRLKSLLRFNWIQPTQRMQTGRLVWMRKKRPRLKPIEYRQPPVDGKLPVINDSVIVASSPLPVPDSLSRLSAAELDPALTDKTEPVEKAVVLISVPNQPPADSVSGLREVLKRHVVRPRQTYYSISNLYGITLRQLYAWNNLSERIPLRIGQTLIVDKGNEKVPVRPEPTVTTQPKILPTAGRVLYHVVRPGQTVYRVALINKVSILDLMRWNNLTNYTIEVGWKLIIRKEE